MKKFLWLSLFLLFVSIIIKWNSHTSIKPPPILGEIPEFHFINSVNDQPFGLEQLRGKINVIDFIFTRCNGPCPIMSKKLSRLYHEFSDNNLVQFISISIDPKNDSSEVLQRYAKEYGVNDTRWYFLRGEMSDIIEFSKTGLKLAADGLPTMHSTSFVLIDDNLRIRGYYDSQDDSRIELLETTLSLLAQDMVSRHQ